MLSPPLVDSKHALKDSVKSACSVRERNVLCERKTFLMSLLTCPFYSEDNSLSHRVTQKNRTHGVSQRPCGRQIAQNVTPIFSNNALWTLYAEGVLWARNVRQKALWTLCALWEKILPSELHVCHLIEWVRSLSHRVTQKKRTHGVSQRPCGRQIAQNVTPIFSSNVLCILYAEGLLWDRNVRQKRSVKSVSSVREKTRWHVQAAQ